MTKPKKKQDVTAAAPARPAPPTIAEKAYLDTAREADALGDAELSPINLDIPVAVSTALGALANLGALRAGLATLPNQETQTLDALERYAHAAWFAHLVALPQPAAGSAVKPLDDEAIPLRETLLSDAEALARRGLLDAATVAAIRAGTGQIDRANDLVALSAVFLAGWDRVTGKTAATLAEVTRAGELGPALLVALGVRRQALPGARPASETRARMFTLFHRAYDRMRRAATYLRWDDGDADAYAPSLYAGRGGRGKAAATAAPSPPESSPLAPPEPPATAEG